MFKGIQTNEKDLQMNICNATSCYLQAGGGSASCICQSHSRMGNLCYKTAVFTIYHSPIFTKDVPEHSDYTGSKAVRRYRYESIIIGTFLDRMRAIKLTNKQYTRILLYFVIH